MGRKPTTRLIILGVTLALVAFACGEDEAEEATTAATTQATVAATEATVAATEATEAPTTTAAPDTTAMAEPEPALPFEGVELQLWRPNWDQAGIDAITEGFQELTGAVIEVTMIPPTASDNVLPRWAAGERPDILYLEGFSSVIATLNPAENLQSVDGMDFTANITPALSPFGVIDGVRYWAPLTAPTVNGLLYNKTVVGDLGLELPGTLDEMLSFCATARDAGTTPVIIGEASTFMGWVVQQAMIADYLVANPDLVERLQGGQASFTDPEFVKRLQALRDMKDADCFQENAEAIDFSTSMTSFMEDEGAIWACASFCIPDLLGAFGPEAVEEKVGFLPISYAETAVWLYGADHWGVLLPKTGDPEREAAARAYVEYITGEGYPLYLEKSLEPSRYPNHPVPDPDALPTPVRTGQAAASEYPAAAALDPRLLCSFGDLFTFLSELFVGQKTAMEIAEAMDSAFAQSCADLGVPGF